MSTRVERKMRGFGRVCARGVLVLTLLFMAFLLPMSLIRTTGMSTGGVGGEIVSFNYDNFFLNIIVLVICTATVYIIARLLAHIPAARVTAVMALWLAVLGTLFVLSAKLQPAEDSYAITFFARQAARGDLSYYNDYFRNFPYQLGFALYEELFFRVFACILPSAPEGFSSLALQVLNAVYLALGCVCIVRCAHYIFKSEDVERITAVLFMFFLPGILFSTYMYGFIPGYAAASAGLLMFLRFTERGKIADGLLCGVFTAAAVILKLNCLVFFIAIMIVWFIALLKKPGIKSALLMVFTAAIVLCAKDMPQKCYESRMDLSFGDGVPQVCWMAMGLSEGKSCSGWYDRIYTTDLYAAEDYDRAATAEKARKVIGERIEYFKSEPREGERFFSRKLLSQWNEPTYQGLWTNQVRKSYSESGALHRIICQTFARRLTHLMNYYQQLIFFGFTLGLVLLLRRGDINGALLPLIVLGGLIYHLFFEAKSQYALVYVMLMVPVAAYGFIRLSKYFARRSDGNGK